MRYHLDYGLSLDNRLGSAGRKTWAITETDSDGKTIGSEQIPWAWTLYFTATSCLLSSQIQIESGSPRTEDAPQNAIERFIQLKLRPAQRGDKQTDRETRYSMFGTKRIIEDFTLDIRQLEDEKEHEQCSAWGSVSYTYEIDVAEKTTSDCVCFYLFVKKELFDSYVDLILNDVLDRVLFSVRSVEGFYSDWSPLISTSRIKVLAGDEHKIEIPANFKDKVWRLGRVNSARLSFYREKDF